MILCSDESLKKILETWTERKTFSKIWCDKKEEEENKFGEFLALSFSIEKRDKEN